MTNHQLANSRLDSTDDGLTFLLVLGSEESIKRHCRSLWLQDQETPTSWIYTRSWLCYCDL